MLNWWLRRKRSSSKNTELSDNKSAEKTLDLSDGDGTAMVVAAPVLNKPNT
jgi:hypothetical protein